MRDNSLEYTFTAPGGNFTFTRLAAITRLKDISFHAGVRSDITSLPLGHGGRFDPGYKEHGVLSVVLKARSLGSAANLEANRTSLVKAVNSCMGSGGGASMTWTNQGSATVLKLSDLYLLDESFMISQDAWDVHLLFGCPKPFAEDNTSTDSDSIALTVGGGGFVIPLTIPFTLTESGGGTLTATHSGDFPYAYPVLRVYGPITNPVVINQTTAQRLVFSGSIAAGEFWEIKLFERTVKLGGTTSVRALTTSQSDWFACALGANTLQLAGSGYTASTLLRCYMRSAWG